MSAKQTTPLKDDSDGASTQARQRLHEIEPTPLLSPSPPARLRTPGQSPESEAGGIVIEEEDNDLFPPPNDIQERLRVKASNNRLLGTSQSSGQNPWASPNHNPQATGQYSVEEEQLSTGRSSPATSVGRESRSQSPHSNKSTKSKKGNASRDSSTGSSRPSLGEKSFSKELLQTYLEQDDKVSARQERVNASAGASPSASMWSKVTSEDGQVGRSEGDSNSESTDHMVTMKRTPASKNGGGNNNINNNSHLHGHQQSAYTKAGGGAFREQHIFDAAGSRVPTNNQGYHKSFPGAAAALHQQPFDQHSRGVYNASTPHHNYTDDESGVNDFELHSVQSDITGLTSAFPHSRSTVAGDITVGGGQRYNGGPSVGLPHPEDDFIEEVPTSKRLDALEQRIQEHQQRSVGSSQQPSSSAESRNRVSFDTVNIREYPRILGNNPSCTAGPAISLGWAYTAQLRWHIEDYEMESAKRERRTGRDLVLEREEREEMLLGLGYSRTDLARAVRKQVKSKNQRRRTVNNLGPVSNMEEKIENASRGMKRLLSFRKGKF